MKLYPLSSPVYRKYFREFLPDFILPRDSNIPVLLSVVDDHNEVIAACIAFRTKLYNYDPQTLRVEMCSCFPNFQYSILFKAIWQASVYLGYDRLLYYGHAEGGAIRCEWFRRTQGRFAWYERSNRTVHDGPDLPFTPDYKGRERRAVIVPENEFIEPKQKKLF